jgi:septation ring formation regulator EzrA
MNTLEDAMNNARTIDLLDEIVVLDPVRLSFNDANLSKYMEEFGIFYDYFSSKTAKAEELAANVELEKENKEAEFFLKGKSEGLTEKASQAYSVIQPEVQDLSKKLNKLNSAVKQLKEYVKALDKAYNMAQSRGHMLRKEMDKLNTDIYHSNRGSSSNVDYSGIEDIIKAVQER